jgi:hypothetical protein
MMSLMSVSACAQTRAPATTTRRDSAGIELVDVPPGSFATVPAWSLDSLPLRIGAVDGPLEYQFSRAGGPWRLATGTIVLPNGQSELRMYDSTGHYLRTVGRSGQGPGEYRQLWNIAPLAGDSILAFDLLGRVSVLDGHGEYARSYAIDPGSVEPPVEWLADRGAIFTVDDWALRSQAARGAGVFQTIALLVRLHSDGVKRDTLDRLPGAWWQYSGPNSAGLPLSGDVLLAAGASGIVAAHGDAFALRWYDPAGRFTRRISVLETPRQSSASDRAAYDSALAARMAAMGRRLGTEGRRGAPMQRYAEHVPLISALRVDRLGCLWVRRWAPAGSVVADWIVMNAEGLPLARVQMPGAFRANDIGGDYVLGLARGADDVDFVWRYRLRRSGTATACSSGGR